jgi:peptidylprolyl isomerase
MPQVQHGDNVKVSYTAKLDDGTVFDSSADREPLQFKVGEGRILKNFETGVVGMEVGDSKTIEIASDEAYGPRRDELMLTVERNRLPQDLDVEVNQQLQLVQDDGQTIVVRVADVGDSTVTLDANHPLAGQDLTFDIQLVEITE